MDENRENPSDINSFRVLNVLRAIKKRKLQAEQLEMPISKHKCWERASASDEIFYGSQKAGSLDRFVAKGKRKGHAFNNCSQPESVKDSNSYGEDSESSESICSEAKMDSGYAKTSDQASSSDDLAMIKGICAEEGIADAQPFLNLQKQLLDIGNHAEFIASEYGDESLDQCTDKELEEILFANGLNSNVYVLSSGRWSINQEAQSGNRKPTIDQEFEQYFSMLML